MTEYQKTLARIDAALDVPRRLHEIAEATGMTQTDVANAMCGQRGIRYGYVGDGKWQRKEA